MTGGGPYFATDVMGTFVYRTAYESTVGMPRLGYAKMCIRDRSCTWWNWAL